VILDTGREQKGLEMGDPCCSCRIIIQRDF